MKDETIVRMLEYTITSLEGVSFPVTTPHLMPVYNAILAAAKANHPNDPFLSTLVSVGDTENGRRSEGSPEELRVLFGLLRIALESYL